MMDLEQDIQADPESQYTQALEADIRTDLGSIIDLARNARTIDDSRNYDERRGELLRSSGIEGVEGIKIGTEVTTLSREDQLDPDKVRALTEELVNGRIEQLNKLRRSNIKIIDSVLSLEPLIEHSEQLKAGLNREQLTEIAPKLVKQYDRRIEFARRAHENPEMVATADINPYRVNKLASLVTIGKDVLGNEQLLEHFYAKHHLGPSLERLLIEIDSIKSSLAAKRETGKENAILEAEGKDVGERDVVDVTDEEVRRSFAIGRIAKIFMQKSKNPEFEIDQMKLDELVEQSISNE